MGNLYYSAIQGQREEINTLVSVVENYQKLEQNYKETLFEKDEIIRLERKKGRRKLFSAIGIGGMLVGGMILILK